MEELIGDFWAASNKASVEAKWKTIQAAIQKFGGACHAAHEGVDFGFGCCPEGWWVPFRDELPRPLPRADGEAGAFLAT